MKRNVLWQLPPCRILKTLKRGDWDEVPWNLRSSLFHFLIAEINKNTLTGPANCKKTTKFWRFRGQISPNSKFFWKIGSFKLKVIFSTNFRPKTKKNRYSRFWENYQSAWFWANLKTFSQISPNQDFFKKSGSVTFVPL